MQMTDGFLFQKGIPRLDVLFVRIDSAARAGLSCRFGSLLRIHRTGRGRLNGFVGTQTILPATTLNERWMLSLITISRNGRAANDVPGEQRPE